MVTLSILTMCSCIQQVLTKHLLLNLCTVLRGQRRGVPGYRPEVAKLVCSEEGYFKFQGEGLAMGRGGLKAGSSVFSGIWIRQ